MKILIVEDDSIFASMLRSWLERLHHSVAVVGDGMEAWRYLEEHDVRLVITDWMMPHLDGPGLCRRIRAETGKPYTYIILMTSLCEPHQKMEGLDAGADDFLTKQAGAAELMARVRIAARILAMQSELEEKNHQLEVWAKTDGLTGVLNRRSFEGSLREALATAGRDRSPLSVVLLDIDRFKSYNDAFGHPGGDEVLCRVGMILRRESRPDHVVARYGGEEFAIVLPNTDVEKARAFAERVRRAIAAHPWSLRPVTASFGVATNGLDGPGNGNLLAEADQALYLAKRTGRDGVVHHLDLSDSTNVRLDARRPHLEHEPIATIPAGARLLHIDDDRDYRRVLERLLVAAQFEVTGVDTVTEGHRRATEGADLILLDIRLPDGDGLEACRRLKADPATAMTPVVLLSGTLLYGDDRARAMAAGASAALPKSSDHEELLAVISALLCASKGERELMRAKLKMAERLRDQAAEFDRLCDATIEGWARALELRDHETEGHSRRVTELMSRVARHMGFDDADLVHMRRGALLHDIGKVGVPDAILNKAAPLDEEEWSTMRRHPELAYDLLRPIEFLKPSLDIPHRHHERWDGTGYPDGLSGEEIPISARIFAAADIYDALSHDRPYRGAWPVDRVREHISSIAGSHLDPVVAEAILAVI